jgi:L-fucose mutarotase
MGHGEWVAVVDANFTANYLAQGKPLVRLPGITLERACQAVLSVFPLDEHVAQPAAYMHVSDMPLNHRTAAQNAVVKLLAKEGVKLKQIEPVERFAFYEKVKTGSLIVQCGEGTAYGNAMFCKGVILV